MIRYRNIRQKRSTCIIAGIVLFVCSVWGAVAPLLIYALPPSLLKARTIAELILTLFAGAGTPTVSPIVMPAIEASVGTDAYTFESLIEEGILQPVDSSLTTEEAIELLGTGNQLQQPFNLDAQAWRTYVEGNWSQMQDYGIDAMLRFQEIANTDSVYGAIDNLGQLALDVGNYGFLGASNAISVLANPGSVVEIGFDTVLDSIKDVFGDYITAGNGIDNIKYGEYNDMPLVAVWDAEYRGPYGWIGDNLYFWGTGVEAAATWGNYEQNTDQCGVAFLAGDDGAIIYRNNKNQSISWNRYTLSPGQVWTAYRSSMTTGRIKNSTNPMFGTQQQALDYLNGIKDGTLQNLTHSPDMTNPMQGMVYDLENLEPAVEAGKGIDLIPYDEYAPYANGITQNVKDNDIDNVPEDTYDFINTYINDVVTENPDNPSYNEDWQNPTIPNTNPIIPDAPVLPESPEISPEVQGQALSAVPKGLEEIFPFCIPWDIYAIVKGLEISRQAPHIVWTFESDLFGFSYTIDLDLSEYDDVAEILRLLELILFIIGLALATRNIIGA